MAFSRAASGPFKDLLPCYYGSIGPLYLTRFDDTGNVQDLARYTPPHTDQQSVEPMGVHAHVINGEMVFFSSIDKDLYPQRYIEMRKMIVETLDPTPLIHPVDGQIYGYFSKFDSSHSAEERNGCRVQFTFERVATSATIVTADVLRDAFGIATIAASAADAAIAAINLKLPFASDLAIKLPPFLSDIDGKKIKDFKSLVTDWRSFLNKGGRDLNTSEITSRLNEARTGINSVINAPQLLDPRNYEVYRSLRQLSTSLTSAAEQAMKQAQTLIQFVTDFETSPQEIARKYYGDVSRADEVASLNQCRYFFYPKNTTIRIADR